LTFSAVSQLQELHTDSSSGRKEQVILN
jgi:hypothetical protein